MHMGSISIPRKRTVSDKRSTLDESLSYTNSETSAHSGRRFHDTTVIFPSRFDYALVIIGLQTGVRQVTFMFMQIEKYGGVMIFLTNFVITILITLPFMVNQIFYGFYNKYGYIKFWNIAPVSFGIGLSMALYSIYECISWSAVTGLLILHICHIPFRGISEWTSCRKMDRPEGILCYDATSNLPNASCPLTTYPAYEFHHKISFEPQMGNRINGPWFVCCFLVWLIVFVMVSQGFRRLRNILINVPIMCLLSLALLATFSFVSQDEIESTEKIELLTVAESPTRYTFVWLVWHSLRVVQIPLGTLCQLGSYSPPGTSIFADSLMILIFSCFYNAGFCFFGHCCHAWVTNRFLHVKLECLAPDGLSIIFSSMPTAISFLAMGNLWLFVFFTGLALKSIIQIVITLTATMNAMSETFHLHRHRQQIVAVTCTIGFLLNLPITMMQSGEFLHNTNRFVELIVDITITAMIGLVLICLYDLSRVFDDIHFSYNVEPVIFQKFTAYLSPVFMVLVMITGITSVISEWPSHPVFVDNNWTGYFVGFTILFLLAPIPAFALHIFIVHLMKHNIAAILQPTQIWGPPEADVKRARSNFNPRSELRYKSKKPCTHNCLLNNLRIKIEVEKRDTQRKDFFLNVFKRPSYAEWDDDEDWRYGGDIIEKARAVDWTGEIGTSHPIITGGRRVLSLMTAMERNEEQQQNKDEEEKDDEVQSEEGDDNFEKDPENESKTKRDNVPINFALVKSFILKETTQSETEINFEPDIILPDFNSAEHPSRIRHLDTYTVLPDRAIRLPRYTDERRTYRYRKISGRERLVETLIEPPPTPITFEKLSRTLRRQSRSKSCQTDKGLKRLQNVVLAILPWKNNNRKKHRCVGTNSERWPSTPGCSKPRTSGFSSEGSETLSEIDEWP